MCMQHPKRLQSVPLSHTGLLLGRRENSELEWLEGAGDVYSIRPGIKSTRHICIEASEAQPPKPVEIITPKDPVVSSYGLEKPISEKTTIGMQFEDLEKNDGTAFKRHLRNRKSLYMILILHTFVFAYIAWHFAQIYFGK